MRGHTATEDGMEGGEHGARGRAAESAPGERRPNGLKMEDNHLHSTAQNGVSGSSARASPFYSHYFESTGKDHIMEATGEESSEGAKLWTILAPPPEFQSTPVDVQPEIKTLENGHTFSEPQKDLFQSLAHNHVQDLFHTLTPNSSANGHFHDETLNPPDLFKKDLPQTQNLSNFSLHLKNSDLFKGKVDDLLQAAQGEDFTHTTRAKEVNLFDKTPSSPENPFISPSSRMDDLFHPSQSTALNPFYSSSTNETDLFQAVSTNTEELFPVKKNEQDPTTKENVRSGLSFQESQDVLSSPFKVDPFASPVARDLFQDVSSLEDPFGTTPSKQYDPFQDGSSGTLDIFQPFALKTNSKDIFEITPSNTASTYSTPSLNSTPELKLDMLSSPDLSEAKSLKSPPAVKPKPSYRPQNIVLTTPRGTKHDILQPTPFIQANHLSVSTSQSPSPSPEMTHVPTFKRPPKPLPRIRPPRTAKPPTPEKPPTPVKPTEPASTVPKVPPKPAFRSLPQPAIRHKPKTLESKQVDAENYVVFEDILLTGQERCVEDWPEDSPQLDPDFKASGKYRLRRESLRMKTDFDSGSGDDQDPSESRSKKKDKKFRMLLVSRRGSKDEFPDETKERSRTLPRKSSQEYFSALHMGAGEIKGAGQNGVEYKKKPLKAKVSQILRRASTSSFTLERKHMKEHLPEESKDDEANKKSSRKKNSIVRRWSEQETMLNDGAEGGEKDEGEAHHGESLQRRKPKVTIQFVPHRGFAISLKKSDDELKGAHGYTPRKGSQDDAFEDAEEMKDLQSSSKAAFMDDKHFQKPDHFFPGLDVEEDAYGIEDCKPRKPMKKKNLHVGQQRSKEDMLEYTKPQKKKSSLSAEELGDEELNGMDESTQDSSHKGPNPGPCKSKTTFNTTGQSERIGFSHHVPQQTSIQDAFANDEDFMSPGDMYDDEQDELESCKPKKTSKLKGLKKYKFKSKVKHTECEDLPGATCSDFMSEAAKAEWLAAQQDEHAMAGLEDEDEEGDTDSLMEWWYTVEKWDEVPSDDENEIIKEDESKSFTVLADKVHRGLRVFNKVFTERAEVLWQYIITLHAIADDINDFHHKAKIAGITGGTTTAVGGVAAITGLALAPFTFGASLLVTAVGVGVATAGGITSASAAISDNVNNMQDQKKVETLLKEYEAHLLDIGKILHFINQGLYKLRGHPFLRSGTQHYSEDWEIRRAVQTITLADSPVMRATEVTDDAVASVQGLFKGMDTYFIKDSRELKKTCKKEMVSKIRELANRLNEAIVELNTIREELQDSTGN